MGPYILASRYHCSDDLWADCEHSRSEAAEIEGGRITMDVTRSRLMAERDGIGSPGSVTAWMMNGWERKDGGRGALQ